MAKIIGGGPPVNDGERRVIAHLRDHGPADWLVLHNIEIPAHGAAYEVDLVIVTGHGVCIVDVKGTHGRIEVAGSRWYPRRGQPFYSPVRKLRGHARALKGVLEKGRPRLSQLYVDQLVVLIAPDARLVDPNDRSDADALDVVDLPGLIPALADVSRVRVGKARDIRPLRTEVLDALNHGVRKPTKPPQFGNWEVVERLGGHSAEPGEDVAEYRARNASAPSAGTVLLRVYQADPFLAEAERAAQRLAIANAYDAVSRMPPHPCIVGCRDFFPVEDESRYVLVLEDLAGQALTVHLSDPRQALGADARGRVITDLLRGLAHAHAHGVLHRALNPSVVLVTGPSGQSLLTGFDYARPDGTRVQTVSAALAAALDPAYVAPECQTRVQAMSRASDVYAAGVVAFRLLTGELPFATTVDQFAKGSELPDEPMRSAGLPPGLIELLRRMSRQKPSARPTAIEALADLTRLSRHNAPPPPPPSTPPRAADEPSRPDYRNLPEGYQLTRKLTVRRRLGKNGGGFATAYQVYDSIAGEDRVAKIVHRDRESVIDRLRLEYQVLKQLPPHRAIVKVEEADILDGGDIPYLLLEYTPGREVSELVADRSVGPADAVRLGIDVAEGLAFLHSRGVYHCDIKPSNLLRTDDGCKIFDFNVAVTADSTMGRVGGTSKYAPVDFGGYGPVGAVDLADRDVYALGLTLYEVLTGRWPFPDASRSLSERPLDPRTFTGLADLSAELVAVLLRAIAPGRADRYATATEFLAALAAIGDRVRHEPEAAEPVPVMIPGSRVGVNPFVDHLRSLFSQSTDSNAGTRSGAAGARFDLYVSTLLDERLTHDVLAGRSRLVIMTGNAGDGKTAFLDRLLRTAAKDGSVQPVRHANGAEFYYPPSRLRLVTNADGSQDEGDRTNDEVLRDFFAPFAGDDLSGVTGETRLIAVNEGRLVDFLTYHRDRFPALADHVRRELDDQDDIEMLDGTRGPLLSESNSAAVPVLVVNLNRRSLLSGQDEEIGTVFDRLLARMAHENHWVACSSCPLMQTCYARHNALTFSHPAAGPRIMTRLRRLYQLTELRGIAHLTVRDVQSALAYMVTSGRSCEQIHDLYRSDRGEQILDSFYFNSWAGPPATKDRLLALLSQVDVAGVADPALDRRLDYVGPDGGRAVMTVDQRGVYDQRLLGVAFGRLSRAGASSVEQIGQHRRYLAASRRRFYFECVDDERARRMLPYRSATNFLALLAAPERADQHLPEIIKALNRSEGMDGAITTRGGPSGDALVLQTRPVSSGSIRGYRLFPGDQFRLTVAGGRTSPYVESGAQELLLRHQAPSGHVTRLRIRLDLFELLIRLRDGYLPSVAEQQGLHLGLAIFKHELSSAPYQQILLTVTGRDLHQITRQPDGTLVMTAVSAAPAGAETADETREDS
ncbi:serine/threonine protein kinase [Frankia sp. CiP3]|uniref:methylation-associated defense system protein kinase MAD6 n=1 Tax=Frankia sp. CiP3 TaxID=2880971 RepID=UPI001EF6E13E|nr:serine/threonine protein kinase [Frankia sp. CiP3]